MVIIASWVRLARGEIYDIEPKSLENVKREKLRNPSPGGQSRNRTRVKTGGNPSPRNWAKLEQMEGEVRTAEMGLLLPLWTQQMVHGG